jgi:transposase-like protein
MRRKVKRSPDELALKIAVEYLTTEISQSELKKKYGFSSTNNIYRWISKFGLSSPNEEEMKLKKVIKKQRPQTTKELKLESEIAILKKELEQERLKSLALSTLIDVAERDLNISIRKKGGARQ